MADPALILIAEVHAAVGAMSQVDELLEPLVAGTRDESGCLGFRVLRADEPGEIVLLSQWESEDALNAHFATTHYRYYAENVGPLLSRASDVVIHHVSSTVHPIDSGGPDPRALG